MFTLDLSQNQTIDFVLVDSSNDNKAGEINVPVFVKKYGGAFVAATNPVVEDANGWYHLVLTAAETDTVGPLDVYFPADAGHVEQNLAYKVRTFAAGCIPFTYTVTNSVTLAPVPDAEVWITTDNDPEGDVVWVGSSDALGVARDVAGNIPCLDAATYYFWAQKIGFTPSAWPDIEIVNP